MARPLFANPTRARVLLLGAEGQPTLARMLEATWPHLQVDERDAPPGPEALEEDDLGGLVARTDALDAATLRLLEHLLPGREALDVLLLVGGRGLAGFEGLLGAPQVRVLPEPVTPAALERMAKTRAAPGDDDAPSDARLAAIEERLDQLMRLEEMLRSQQIELARLRQDRAMQDEERLRNEMLRAFLRQRDRLADLVDDLAGGAPPDAAEAVLRAFDEDLATQGVVMDRSPDVDDAGAATVIASRPRTAADPRTRSIVRRPAFFRVADGERRVLRPAEIELLE